MSSILSTQAKSFTKKRPEIRPGYTVRVHEKIKEGDKERIQIFEGLVISAHKGMHPTDSTITVRKIVSGVGVEKLFSIHSPRIEKIEVKKVAKVRRAKLYFLRGLQGKAARLQERFTTADEFNDIAVEQEEEQEEAAEDANETSEEVAEAQPEEKAEAAPADEAKDESGEEKPEEEVGEEVKAEEEKPEEKEEEKKD